MLAALAEALADQPESIRSLAPRLLQHWQLVCHWNARTNLTSIRQDQDAAWLHYRDSLELVRFLDAGPILDVGSGAGFPGIPIAMALPDCEVTLLEPRRKRASFLRTAKARLHLDNVRVLQGASTDTPDKLYAAVVSRATFSADADVQHCLTWLKPEGRLIAMRSEAAASIGAERHPYTLGQKQRFLDIWQAGG
ncbi:MAG: 16S rRNA (guanine(527)-N(7))-methyltransferase RsmG [Myxococcota bacterium]